MSKLICKNAIDGAALWVARAEAKLGEAIKAFGERSAVGFPNTAYYLPIIYSFTGEKVATLADCRKIIARAKELLPVRPSDSVWLPYLGNALDAGTATLFACEVLEACKYLVGPKPVDGIWLGAASDVIMRERGIEFVDGTAPGFAAIVGAAPSNAIAVKIARELQEKNLYVFMAGTTKGRQFADQLAEEKIQLGWETRLVPFGRDVSAAVYALGFASRVALSFGGVKPGDFKANLHYSKNRVFAFVLAFDEVDMEKYAVAAGAINYGFPVIADTDIPEILPTGVCTYEHVVSKVPHETMVERALEVRGCKIRVTCVPIPVSYGPAFEGERIRKADMHIEFGGNKTTAFEFVTSAELDAINDGEITIVGPDIDEVAEGTVLPLAIWVEVAGRKMQTDFEPILERQIHHLLNGASGLWHMGQRDIVWTRVSKEAFRKGMRLKHYGEIIHAKFLGEYPAIVDKVKVTIFTEAAEVEKRVAMARVIYDERNRRLESMTDESVGTFYSCLLCQSFAPNHVCIITPERLGLCGAYNWLDGKAAYEIDETGPNQPIGKGECLDPVKGIWKNVNDYVFSHSHKTVDTFCAYSIMDRPMTSCGCFEVICAYVPECNGIMAVNREFTGDTPVGMTFSTLAGSVGGGQQTPGFMGVGKVFLTSRKFLFTEGGHKRLVWMPKELKKLLADDLNKCFADQGAPDLMEKIADETVATDAKEVRVFLEKVKHPAVEMNDMSCYAEGVKKVEDAVVIPAKAGIPLDSLDSRLRGNDNLHGNDNTGDISKFSAELEARVRQEVGDAAARDILLKIVGEMSGRLSEPKGETAAVRETGGSRPSAVERLNAVRSFNISKEKSDGKVWTVTLGATKEQGGTRGKTLKIGGATAMPFHLWEGEMPHRPVVAMEVFDRVSEKYPPVLKKIYGDLLDDPARMAKACVERYGADLISVRLEGTHPEKGDLSPAQAVATVRSVLKAVEVPLIITGHSHFEKMNEVMRAVTHEFQGENLLINWVEQENYRTIAGMALAYGHSIVAQSPIDVNISKQMNILLTGMNVGRERIVVDPMTGAMGYGIEYTYSVMERIRLGGLGGDEMLAGPMLVSPGQECAKIKELKATEEAFPEWGGLARRAALWELSTATNLLYAGADILILYHPEAAVALKKAIFELMDM